MDKSNKITVGIVDAARKANELETTRAKSADRMRALQIALDGIVRQNCEIATLREDARVALILRENQRTTIRELQADIDTLRAAARAQCDYAERNQNADSTGTLCALRVVLDTMENSN